jgi:hypothetical protein
VLDNLYDIASLGLGGSFIHERLGPKQVIVLNRAFGDAFVDKLPYRLLGGRKVAACDALVDPRDLFGRERDRHGSSYSTNGIIGKV